MNCQKCKYELFKDFNFCYECGEPIKDCGVEKENNCRNANNWSKLKCLGCNSMLYNDAKFCHKCGQFVANKIKLKTKELFGWISVILSFIYPPVGASIALILSIILLKRKEQNHTLALGGLIFSSAILVLFFILMFLL